MKKRKQSRSSVGTPNAIPIIIRVAYDWGGSETTAQKQAKQHWLKIHELIRKCVGEVNQRRGNTLAVRVGRLRAGHGTCLLGSIIERIKTADILIFDMHKMNPNVLFEYGLAMGVRGCVAKSLYALAVDPKVGPKPPSDLISRMFTYYSLTDNTLRLNDLRGFWAAMVASIIGVAQEKGMLPVPSFEVEKDENEAEES